MNEENSIPDEHAVDWSALESVDAGPTVLTPEMIAMRILWDVVPCNLVEQVAQYMGLPATSEDVMERDHEESHLRMMDVVPLDPFFQTLAFHATNAVVAATTYSNAQEGMVPLATAEERADITERTLPLIYQSVVAVVSELVSIGVLHLPHMRSVSEFMKDPSDVGDGE